MRTINQAISAIPDPGHRGEDLRDDFVLKQEAYQDHQQLVLGPELNIMITEVNDVVEDIDAAVNTVVAKEAAISPYYVTIDTINANIDDVISLSNNIASVITVGDAITAVNTVSSNISSVNSVSTNMPAVQHLDNKLNDILDTNAHLPAISIVADDLTSGGSSIIGVSQHISDVVEVGSSLAAVVGVANNIDNINNVQGVYADVVTTAQSINNTAIALTQVAFNLTTIDDGELIMQFADPVTNVSLNADNELIVEF